MEGWERTTLILRTELEALLRAIYDAPFGGHLRSSTWKKKDIGGLILLLI